MFGNPRFLFIPGAWHTPAYFEPVIAKLVDQGYESQSVALPSVGTEPPADSIESDIDAIASAISSSTNQGKDLIVVMHSYGGMCGTAAITRAIQQQNTATNIGQIKRLIYVASFVPQEGESLEGLKTLLPAPPSEGVQFRHFEDLWVSLNNNAAEALYQDVPEPILREWRHLTDRHAASSFKTPVTSIGWRLFPTTYIYTTLDKALDLENQKWLVRRARKSGVQESGIVPFDGIVGEIFLKSGHTPFLSEVDELVKALVNVAENS